MKALTPLGRSAALALFALFVALCCFKPLKAQEQIRPAYTAEFVAQMLDYVSRDYAMAVSNGQIIDADEYEEQLVVCNAALEVGDQVQSLVAQPSVRNGILALIEQIKAKAPAPAIKQQALAVRDSIFAAAGVSLAPARWPSQARGQQVFESNCVSCHGIKGDGQGAAAHTLTPRPANLLDPVRMKTVSPHSSYGAIKMGIPGTAMTGAPHLSDDDLWAVSFYVASLRQRQAAPVPGRLDPTASSIWLKATASLPDDELMQALPGNAVERAKLLALLRLHSE